MTIRLYLLRHGPAGDRSDWIGDDADRPLTKDGVRRVKQIARALATEDLRLDVIVTSPLARCAQTAELVAAELDLTEVVSTDPALAPGFRTADVAGLLHRHPTAGSVMLVGHEPDLSTVCAGLCGARVELQKGALAELELDRRQVTDALLVRLEQPSHLLCASAGPRLRTVPSRARLS